MTTMHKREFFKKTMDLEPARKSILLGSMVFLAILVFLLTAMIVPPDQEHENIYQQVVRLQQHVEALQQQLKSTQPPFVMPESVKLCGMTIDLTDPFIYRRVKREVNEIVFREGELGNLVDFSGEFFPVIEPILARENIPDDMKYLVAVESNFKVKAASYAGAKGLWQFIDSSARLHGLASNDIYDERYQLSKATEAAVRHLKASYRLFGDWLLAITAYNKGDRGVNNILTIQGIDLTFDVASERLNEPPDDDAIPLGDETLESTMAEQRDSNFWDLVLLVPVNRKGKTVAYRNEQERYVPRVIAMKLILENAYDYDFLKFDAKNRFKPIPTDTVTAQKTISALDLAKELPISLWNLKYLNPQYKGLYPVFPAGRQFEIPQGMAVRFEEVKDQIKEYRGMPASKRSSSAKSASTSSRRGALKDGKDAPESIILRSNETLWDISRRFNVPMKTILELNDITYQSAKFLKPGRKIVLRAD